MNEHTQAVLRWIDTDLDLLWHAQWTVSHMDLFDAAETLAAVDWEEYDDNIDRSEVDWDAVVEHLTGGES